MCIIVIPHFTVLQNGEMIGISTDPIRKQSQYSPHGSVARRCMLHAGSSLRKTAV